MKGHNDAYYDDATDSSSTFSDENIPVIVPILNLCPQGLNVGGITELQK